MTLARWLFYLWAAALPFVSFSTTKPSESLAASSRLTAADVIGALCILFSLPAFRWFVPSRAFPWRSSWVLLAAAVVSSYLAGVFLVERLSLARLMLPAAILAYLMLISMRGVVLMRSERELMALACAIAAGGTVETLIVGHDVLARVFEWPVWFPDPMALRLRGTFRSSGQLAQYGFVAGGILFALAAWPRRIGRPLRWWLNLTAVSLLLYPIFASRRSGIGAVFILFAAWIALDHYYGRVSPGKVLPVVLPVCLLLLVYLAHQDYRRFLTDRIEGAQEKILDRGSYMYDDLRIAAQNFSIYPVFGVGWGLNPTVTEDGNEVHSGYLAVLTDAGLLGLIAYASMLLALVFLCWRMSRLTRGTPYLEPFIRLSAMLIAQSAFWHHNRGLRDRGFFLYLAVLVACAEIARAALSARHAPAPAAAPGETVHAA